MTRRCSVMRMPVAAQRASMPVVLSAGVDFSAVIRVNAHFPKFVLHLKRPPFTNFGKSWALAKFMVLVPLFYLKFLDRFSGSWCRDFKKAGLVHSTGVKTRI